jgi:hypothetical protein
MKKLYFLVSLLAAFAAWNSWVNRSLDHPPGVLVPSAPLQTPVAAAEPFMLNGYSLTPRADFSLRARVLSRENYHWGVEAELSPLDLALGWGVMSDQAVLDRIRITQGGRWYFTRYDRPGPISDAAIIRNSSNMHIVPADAWVAGKLNDVVRGDLLLMSGLLVDVDHPSGFQWRTSLRRDDTGNGSCEVFYVDYIEIADRP